MKCYTKLLCEGFGGKLILYFYTSNALIIEVFLIYYPHRTNILSVLSLFFKNVDTVEQIYSLGNDFKNIL